MKSFSERKGLKPVREVIQTDSMDEALRNSLWNALDFAIWSRAGFLPHRSTGLRPDIEPFSRSLWFGHFKAPIDERPGDPPRILAEIKKYFFHCAWNELYDFLEFVVSMRELPEPCLPDWLNVVLERELSGYRMVGGHFVDITNHEELAAIEEATSDTRWAGVSTHIQRALELYANRENPDYRNSIKESISAVESAARLVADQPKATLGDAMKIIEKDHRLHSALKEGFLKLYGYTSDEQGIRHAMTDEPNLSAADARFFLVSCSAFVNYLKAQLPAR